VNISVSERRPTPYASARARPGASSKKFWEGVDVWSGIFRVAAGAGDSARRCGVGAGGMIGSRDLQSCMAGVEALE
jgi:hypothetical protein